MKPGTTLLLFIFILLLGSCRNKTVLLLTKKWDCVQVDNIIPPDAKLISREDSVRFDQVKSLLQSLSWTFKKNMGYECAINSRVTVSGKYELLENDKIIVCTSESKNSVNRYVIKTLTENELVLSGVAANSAVVLHFKPN